jgi:hypothetical protein
MYEIIVVPAAIPFTTPVVLFTVPTAVLELLQVPPVAAIARVVVVPVHTVALPVIGAGAALTVSTRVTLQPVGNSYTMVTIPDATPVTTPEDEPTIAIEVLLLLHAPPGVALLSAVVKPGQTLAVPNIAAGTGLIEICLVEMHPPGSV